MAWTKELKTRDVFMIVSFLFAGTIAFSSWILEYVDVNTLVIVLYLFVSLVALTAKREISALKNGQK